ncbi:MAG: sorbosone dehydrogenase family protein [Hyphomonadaceae bacterium]|nr:sorbosone dehydrogenase family protein [Hyphomonadaceae bacterium]
MLKKLILASALLIAACGGDAPPADTTYGADPQLPAPAGGMPVVNPATAVGWPDGASPTAPEGFTVQRFAEGLDHPRWLHVLPNGDVLVAESATEAQQGGGIMGWIRNSVQRRAGALSESPDRIILLRDADRDGIAEARHVFAEGLNQPFGMQLVGEYLYVANTDAVVRFRYTPNSVRAPGRPETILELPHNPGDNGHWTRNLIAREDGMKLYVAVGSVSNVGDNGMQVEEGRAAIWEFNPDGSDARIYASGLRNPVGMAWAGGTGRLWVAVNERDMLGDNLVPDYMTSVQDGGFYGWPFYYWGANRDERIAIPPNVRLQAPIAPDYALGAHTASLGLFFYHYDAFPERYWNGAFIGQHGSWNRSERVGYKVIFVPFREGVPAGPPEDFLVGFLNARGEAQGRPVGVTMDQTGALLVADDVGNIIWRVSIDEPAAPTE